MNQDVQAAGGLGNAERRVTAEGQREANMEEATHASAGPAAAIPAAGEASADTVEVELQVEANLARNFVANVLDLSFFMFGINIVSQTTILPLLVSRLTSSIVAIGLISALTSLGYLVPQLLLANHTEGLRRKKPFILFWGALERGPYLLMGLAVWWLAGPLPGLALVAVLGLRTISALAGGIVTPAWFDLIAKVIPANRRGLYSGVGNGLGALLGVVGAGLAGWILARWDFPANFALCFVASSVLMVASYLAFLGNREPDSPVVKHRLALRDYLRKLPAVVSGDANYRAYLISRATLILGTMATGYYLVYGIEHLHIPESEAGGLTALLVGSQAVANLLWGPLGDRLGHKRVLVGEAVGSALAAGVAFLATGAVGLWLTFVLFGIAVAAGSVSGLNIILEFCAPADRPTYIGLTNTALAPVATLAPIIGGWLATWVGYRPMFVISAVVCLAGALMMALWVQEPRPGGKADHGDAETPGAETVV
jgi:MFS family permease